MNASWSKVFIAAFFEVGWVVGLKYADSVLEWAGTALAIAASFYLLLAATKKLPVGTVYAVFVGLGTAGTVLAEMAFGEPMNIGKIALILLLLVGVMGLKAVTAEGDEA